MFGFRSQDGPKKQIICKPWQRGLAYSIGKIVARSGKVSRKQANHGVTLLSAAEKLGFKANDATTQS